MNPLQEFASFSIGQSKPPAGHLEWDNIWDMDMIKKDLSHCTADNAYVIHGVNGHGALELAVVVQWILRKQLPFRLFAECVLRIEDRPLMTEGSRISTYKPGVITVLNVQKRTSKATTKKHVVLLDVAKYRRVKYVHKRNIANTVPATHSEADILSWLDVVDAVSSAEETVTDPLADISASIRDIAKRNCVRVPDRRTSVSHALKEPSYYSEVERALHAAPSVHGGRSKSFQYKELQHVQAYTI